MSIRPSIALNRFGLGARPGDDPGGEPGKWLIAQFDRYDAAPAAIAAVAPSGRIVSDLADYFERGMW